MASRLTSRLCTCGTALAALSISLLSTAHPASAQEIERLLAGVRLGSRGTTVLAKYGNPNYVIIGDVGVRQAPGSATGNGQGAAGQGGDREGGAPTPSAGGGGALQPGGPKRSGGTMGFGGGPPGGGMSGPIGSSGPSGPIGSGGGFGGGDPRGGFGQGGEGGGASGATGAFGQTVSPLANEQEVTWVYNRKVGNNVVSYEFLIGPSGDVSQIRVIGYSGGNSKTKRGIVLGSTYKDVVRTYGYPEDHQQVGDILIASYKQRDHVSFQFHQTGPTSQPGDKVIAITIATVE